MNLSLHPDVFRAWQDESRRLDGLQLIFLVGPPKCGTTWILQTLLAHPDTAGGGESHFATRLAPALRRALADYDAAHKAQAGQAGHRPRPWLTDLDSLALQRQACDRILLALLHRADPARAVTHLIDKTPGHARHVALLARLYPAAKFVCITRDVRDAAVSAYFYFTRIGARFLGEGSIEDITETYARDHWAELLRHARHDGRALGPLRYFEASYELHQSSPHHSVAALLQFCNLPADPMTVQACIDRADFSRITGREPGEEAPAFHRKGIVGDWKNHLSSQWGERLRAVAQERLVTPVDAGCAPMT